MRRYYFPKRYAAFAAKVRVPGGFLLVGAFAWLAKPSPLALGCGGAVAILGIWLRAWAAGHLAKNQELATSGPYRYLRNPLYAGTLIVAAGLVIASRQAGLAVLSAAVFLGIYLPVIEQEEQHLRKLFPDYEAYAAAVPLLWPKRGYKGGGKRFSWRLYWRNQEYQAAFGLLAGLVFLYWKMKAGL